MIETKPIGRQRAIPTLQALQNVRLCYIALLWSASLATFIAFLVRSLRGIWAPYELEYGEGLVLWQASHVFHLKEAFGAMQKLPYMVFHYTPLYHVLSRVVGFAVGDLLSAGRLISFASTLAVGAIFGVLVFRCLPARMPASIRLTGALTGGLLCYGLETIDWMRYMRVDGLAVALSFLGLACFILGMRRPALEYAAFVIFFLAIYTKQTMVAAPAACALAAAISSPRRALRLIGLLAVCCLVILAALMYATEGRVVRHWFLYNRNPFHLSHLYKFLKSNVLSMKIVGVLAASQVFAYFFPLVSLSTRARWIRIRAGLQHSLYHRALFVLGVHLTLAFGMAFLVGKEGASYNYFLEWNLACCPLAGLLVAAALSSPRRPSVAQVAVLLFALVASAEAFRTSAFAGNDPENADFARDSATVLAIVRKTPGLVYSENMTLLMQAGKESPAEPAIITVLAKAGAWDERPFVGLIRSRVFERIVVTSSLANRERFTPAVAEAVEQVYTVAETYGVYKIYRARPSAGN